MAEQDKGAGSGRPAKPVSPSPPKPKPTTVRGGKVIKIQSNSDNKGGKK